MQEITKTEDRRSKTEKITWLLFALVIVAVYFFALDLPLLGPDEPRYAQVAREMFERNDWVTPTLGGANWFEKPALLYWLQFAAYKIFGVSEFAARFGSAIFGLGTILSLWILGRSLAEENAKKHREIQTSQKISSFSANSAAKKEFANWLALIAASSIGLIAFSRGASFDIILTFPITAALVSFFIFDQTKKQSSFTVYFSLFSFYFFIGLALLAKGLIGIVFPAAIVALYFLLSRKLPNKTFVFSLFWGTILSLIVASSWYLPMYRAHGWTFIDEFFIQHHFQRYTSNKYQHPQPFYFFFWVLPLMTLPWLPFFASAIWNFVKKFFGRRNVEGTPRDEISALCSSLSTFAFSWLLVPLVFFSFSGSKLPGYILPALPAALVLTAEYVRRFTANSRKRKLAIQFTAFTMFAVIAVALRFFVPSYAQADTTKYLIETADSEGYRDAKILNLHTISHNAEFYGAGRLIRDADGKLKKHFGVSEVAEEIKRQNGKTVLVLVTLEYLHELPESNLVESKILGESGELAIVAVKGR
jgi:4-amino-4-deoxy-L-arabinose transferase-like glycosyltransferase